MKIILPLIIFILSSMLSYASEKEAYSKEVLDIAKRIGFKPSAVAKARSLTNQELKELVNNYVREAHQSKSYWALLPARDLASKYLIDVLKREDAFTPNEAQKKTRESQGSRALRFLDAQKHPELKPILQNWAETDDKTILCKIAISYVAFGTDDLLPDIKKLFEHPDQFIASSARHGAIKALKANQAEQKFKSYVWNNSEKLLVTGAPMQHMYDPIRVLTLIDREKTKRLLLSDRVLRIAHPLLDRIIQSLNQLSAPAPANFLLKIIENPAAIHRIAKRRAKQHAIFGLIMHGHPAASTHIEKILKNTASHSENMVLAAWRGRFKLKKLTPIMESSASLYQKADYSIKPLNMQQRAMIYMSNLDSEVSNGGFSQWYFNTGGNNANLTLKALVMIGANKHAAIVAKANSLFGKDGPAQQRTKRQEQLENMRPPNAAIMDKLNTLWYDLPSWEVQAWQWDWNQQSKSK